MVGPDDYDAVYVCVCVLSYIVDYAGMFIIFYDISSMVLLLPLRSSFFKGGSTNKLISTNNMSKTAVFLSDGLFVFAVPATCRTDSCQNSGTCSITSQGEISCQCKSGYIGIFCEETETTVSIYVNITQSMSSTSVPQNGN